LKGLYFLNFGLALVFGPTASTSLPSQLARSPGQPSLPCPSSHYRVSSAQLSSSSGQSRSSATTRLRRTAPAITSFRFRNGRSTHPSSLPTTRPIPPEMAHNGAPLRHRLRSSPRPYKRRLSTLPPSHHPGVPPSHFPHS
jgi:hypothetical protein